MMAYTRAWPQPWTSWFLYGLLFLTFSVWTEALSISYCSPDNDAGSNFVTNSFMSNGVCQDHCKESYVFAVIQGQSCWCSDYIPADQVSNSECSDPCPGYPYETCGSSDQGLYGYFNLGGTPSGTAGGSSHSASSSPSRTSTSPSPSSSAEPSRSSLRSSTSSASPSPTPEPTQVYTSVVTITGKASTILVTPSSAPATATDSALGGAAPQKSGGVSGGTVAGIVIGVAIGIGLIIGGVVFLCLRRRHRKNLDAISEGGSFTSPSHASKSAGGIPSRQVSQMSSAGLLTKPTRVNTSGFSNGDDQRSNGNGTLASDRNSTHMTVDQRLNPWAIYSSEESRVSNVSLQDNQDYSRQLRVANPDT